MTTTHTDPTQPLVTAHDTSQQERWRRAFVRDAAALLELRGHSAAAECLRREYGEDEQR